MIKFGKTHEEALVLKQEAIRKKIYGVEKYAWYPVRIVSGEWIWFTKYFSYYTGGVSPSTKELFLIGNNLLGDRKRNCLSRDPKYVDLSTDFVSFSGGYEY